MAEQATSVRGGAAARGGNARVRPALALFPGSPAPLNADQRFIPLDGREKSASVRVGLIAGPDGKPVLLRSRRDAKVYLGALCDRRPGSPVAHRMLEIWVQDVTGSQALPESVRRGLTGSILDEAWRARAGMLADMAAEGEAGGTDVIWTGRETEHGRPLFLDTARGEMVEASWFLCRDASLLSAAGVARYSEGLERHLKADEGDGLIPAKSADAAKMGVAAELKPFNVQCGLMMTRVFAPLSFEQYVDALTGASSKTVVGEGLGRTLEEVTGASSSGWLLSTGQDRGTRMAEVLHLKLMALSQAAALARAGAAATGAPMLNLRADSYRVRLAEGGGEALPRLWSARLVLADPGDAAAVPVEGSETVLFVPGSPTRSVYSPAAAGRNARGSGWLRLRQVIEERGGRFIVEGTLSAQERLEASKSDLVLIRATLNGRPFDFTAAFDEDAALTSGEVRVRSLPRSMEVDELAEVNGAMGVPLPDTQYEVLPRLSTACDLYGLGILAVRTLLTHSARPLPVAVDELLSLARKAAEAPGENLPTRISSVLSSDERFAAGLGARHLTLESAGAAEADVLVPDRLWVRVLAMMVRCMTGATKDAWRRDLGDAPEGAGEKVFDGLLDDLYALIRGCRGLLVNTRGQSREIREVLRGCLARVGG